MKPIRAIGALPLCLLCCLGSLNAQIVPAPTEKQMAAMDRIAAPLRKKVTDILEADKSGQYQKYLADVRVMADASDPAERKALAERLRQDHYDFIKKAFVEAKIDLAGLKRQYAEVLGHSKFTMDEFGGLTSHTEIPKAIPPLSFDGELTCPYNIKDDFANVAGLAGCTADIPGCSITLDVNAFSLAAGCRTKGSIGDKLTLPAGNFTKATVNARFNFDYYGIAMSLAGYGQYNAKLGLRLTGNNLDKVTIIHDAWCFAPIIFYNTVEKDAFDFPAQVTFTGSFNGDLNPMVYCENFVLALGINSTCGFMHVNSIDFIKLDASN